MPLLNNFLRIWLYTKIKFDVFHLKLWNLSCQMPFFLRSNPTGDPSGIHHHSLCSITLNLRLFTHRAINRKISTDDKKECHSVSYGEKVTWGENYWPWATESMLKPVCGTGRVGETLVFVPLLSSGCCNKWRCTAFYCLVHSCVWAVYCYHTSVLCV